MGGGARGVRSSWGQTLLVCSLAASLAFLALDSSVRLRPIRALQQERITEFPAPRADPASPSGYALGQHDLILPTLGTDGYQWILQTEQASRDGLLRVHTVDYDNAPAGREAHWASPLRWWSQGLAAAYQLTHGGLSFPLALDRVAPWANTLLATLLIVILVALIAWKLGAPAAAVFALGSVTAYPFYEYFVIGYFDHHALATLTSMAGVLLLVIGGAGWVPSRGETASGGASTARRWFVAAAVASAAGMWVSAATAAPVILGVGAAALGCIAWSVRPPTPRDRVRYEPALWRAWGVAGALASLLFYAVEYLPGGFGLRLEVNHPLYAVAWLGAGDLFARLGARRVETGDVLSGRGAAWLTADVLGILLLPATALLLGDSSFRLGDPFLWALHERFIVEFLSLRQHLALMTPGEILAGVSVAPLAVMPATALLWGSTPQKGRGLRALLTLAAALGVAFAATVLVGLLPAFSRSPGAAPRELPGAGWWLLAIAALSVIVAFLALRAIPDGAFALSEERRTQLTFALVPQLLPLAMSLVQVRWLGIATGLSLVLLAVSASALSAGALRWTARGRIAVAAALALVFLPYPLFALRQAAAARSSASPVYHPDDVRQLATREVAHWLRARVGNEPAVVFAGPTSTAQLVYFGGFRGVGTLYWENVDGLRESAALASARTADDAKALIHRHGITHLVLFSWDSGLESLVSAAGQDVAQERPFLRQLMDDASFSGAGRLPTWLDPMFYPLPQVGPLAGARVRVLEVNFAEPPEVHLVRVAQYLHESGQPELAEQALRESLLIRPNVPALALLAQLQQLGGQRDAFLQTLQALQAQLAQEPREPLDLSDRINVILALGLGGVTNAAAEELRAALTVADERGIRRTPPRSLAIFIAMTRQLGLDGEHEGLIRLARGLLPESERANLGF